MRNTLTLLGSVVSLVLLANCGGGGGGSDTGTFSVALTDAASDEIDSFTIDVDSLTLTKADGAVVNVLSTPVHVDLAELDDLSQVVNVVDVPAGLYESATITLDFATANCVLIGQTTAATLLDENGNPLTGQVTLPLSLNGAPAEALGRRHRVLELDFDLNDSASVDVPSNTVTVSPVLIMRVDRRDPRKLVAMGQLESVNVDRMRAKVELQSPTGLDLGEVEFQFDGGTIFQIDGVAGTGSASLAALKAEPQGTSIEAYGAVEAGTRRIHVSVVAAGLGTWNGGSDIVEGHIVARSGGAGADATFTVLGRGINATHDTFVFNTDFTVKTTFAATHVERRDDATNFDTDELDIGQRVRCYGTLSGTTLDASTSSGIVREQPTSIFGFANDAPSGGALEIDLSRVGLRDQSLFDWPGAGSTPHDPAHLTLDVGNLGDGLGIVSGTPVEARGYFSSFTDPGANFDADSLANLSQVGTAMVIVDRIGGMDVTTDATASQIQFTITGSPGLFELAAIDQGFAGLQPLPDSPTPTVIPAATTDVFFTLDLLTGEATFELDFSRFSKLIADNLADGRRLFVFHALGGYDAPSNTLSAVMACAVFR